MIKSSPRKLAPQRRLDSFRKELGALTGLILLCIVMSFASPYFLSLTNLMNVLRQSTLIGIVAAGMTMIIITGGIDLSVVGSQPVQLFDRWNDHLVWLERVVIRGAGHYYRCCIWPAERLAYHPDPAASFIATLGIMGVARGLAFVYTGGAPIYTFPKSFRYLGQGMIGPVPFPVILMLIIYVLFYILLKRTKLGRYTYAIGGNEEAAILSGIQVGKFKTVVYALTGALAALAGMILAARLDAATSVAGDGFELDVIAAVVIGGTSLSGGQGGVIGSLIGALIMGVVRNGLNLLLVSSHWQRVILGVIILVAVTVDVLRKRGVFVKSRG